MAISQRALVGGLAGVESAMREIWHVDGLKLKLLEVRRGRQY